MTIFLACSDHLDTLKMDMTKRFTELLELEISDWFIDSFCVDNLQAEFIELQNYCGKKASCTVIGPENFRLQSLNATSLQHCEL